MSPVPKKHSWVPLPTRGSLYATQLLKDQMRRGREQAAYEQTEPTQSHTGPTQKPARLRAQGSPSPHIAVLAGHSHVLLGDVNVHVIQGGLLCHMVGTDKV